MPNSILQAALDYAANGYAVFPCSPVDKRPLLSGEKGKKDGGFKKASADPATIEGWWKKWPKAMIGLPLRSLAADAFVLDLDLGDPPLIEASAYLGKLIRWLDDTFGEALPPDLPISETGSGGYHLWLASDGRAIGNRGNFIHALTIAQPEGAKAKDGGLAKAAHIDVRGQTGYVIVPPSVRADGGKYSFAQGDLDHGLPHCPPKLLALVTKELREDSQSGSIEDQSDASRPPHPSASPTPSPTKGRRLSAAPPSVEDHVRRYALAALDEELRRVGQAVPGTRNEILNEASFKLGQLVGAGALSEIVVVMSLDDIVRAWPDLPKSQDTIRRGVSDGAKNPRNLSDVRANAERRAARRTQGARLRPIDGGKAHGSASDQPPEDRRRSEATSGVRTAGRSAGLPEPAASPPRQLEMREILREQRKRDDPPPTEKRNGVGPGRWTPDILGLPREDPCPVIPLGINGRKYFFLDSAGQDTAIAASSLNQAGIQDLFAAAPHWIEWACPRWGEKKVPHPESGEMVKQLVVASHQGDDVRKMLFRACVRKGHFDPDQKVRGRGAWRRADGSLLYHAGEELWIVEPPFSAGARVRAIDTGILEDGGRELVFPRRPALPAPWPHKVTPQNNPAKMLIEGFRRWQWERPDIAPVLLLGAVASMMLGGALDWRPATVLIGDYSTGKSTLQRAIKDIFGDALLDSVNASAASIYQSLAHDTRPVALDEFEGKQDPRREQAIVELMRQAASGGVGRRGTSDASAGGVEFEIRSSFLLSFIQTPPLLPQDLSRMAILRLRPLPKSSVDEKGERRDKPITIDQESCGRMLLALLMGEWHRFEATLEAYRKVLEAGGHSSRGRDTYGTLLACADMALGPELAEALGVPMVDDLSPWSELLAVETLPELDDAIANWRGALNHMLQSRVEMWRHGERATVGALLEDFFAGESEHISDKYVRRQLGQAGLGFHYDSARGWLLAVPTQSSLLERLFFGSRWQGVAGAGGWAEAFRQAPDDVVWSGREAPRPRINGVQGRCALIVLSAIGFGEKRRLDLTGDALATAPAPAPAPIGGR